MKAGLRRHANTHAPQGSDPIDFGDGLRYDFDNEGDWFFAAANDTSAAGGAPSIGYTDQAGNTYGTGFSWQFDTGDSAAPFAVTNDGGFLVDTAGTISLEGGSAINLFTASLEATISNHFSTFLGTGTSFTIYDNVSTPVLTVTEDGEIHAICDTPGFSISSGGPIELALQSGGGDVLIDTSGVTVSLAAGDTFTVKDHLGNPKLQWTEGTADLHIPTGGTVIANL